jgi:hypothetical protein
LRFGYRKARHATLVAQNALSYFKCQHNLIK